MPLDIHLQTLPREGCVPAKQYRKFIEEWEKQMTEAYRIAKERCDKVKKYSEDQWRKRRMATELHPGDKVLVKINASKEDRGS